MVVEISFFSDNFSLSTNILNSVKKFLDNPLFSNYFINYNLWLSLNLSSKEDLYLLNFLEYNITSKCWLNKNYSNVIGLLNLNFTEDAILWNFIRFNYYYLVFSTNSLSSNLLNYFDYLQLF